MAVGTRRGGAAGHHLQVLSVDALEGGGGGVQAAVLLFLLLKAGGLFGPQVLNKVLNGVVLLLAAAETVEIKFLQLAGGVLTITLKQRLVLLFHAVLGGRLRAVVVVLWIGEGVLAMGLVLYMRIQINYKFIGSTSGISSFCNKISSGS